MARKPDEQLDESMGDLFFTPRPGVSQPICFSGRNVTSRTFRFYYPAHASCMAAAVLDFSSTKGPNYSDWVILAKKNRLEQALPGSKDARHLDQYVPNIRQRTDHVEASDAQTSSLHPPRRRREFWHEFEGVASAARFPTNFGVTTRGRCRIIMSGLASARLIWPYRRQRCRMPC